MDMKLAGSLVAMLAAASPAVAQDPKRPVSFDLSVSVLHDDNIARSSEAVAARRGIVPEDTVFSPTASIDLQKAFGRQSVFLIGGAGYVFHQENDDLDAERIDIRGGVNNAFGPCVTTLEGRFARAQSELQEVLIGPVDNIETVTGATFSGACGRATGLAGTGEVAWEQSDNSAGGRESLNFTETSAMAGLMYRRPTLGELTIFAQTGKTEYEDNPLLPKTGQEGYKTRGAGLRYSRRFGARIQGTVTAGYTEVEPNAANVERFSGTTYGVELTYRPSSRLQAIAMLKREIQPSSLLGSAYTLEELYSIQGEYRFGTRIRLALGAARTDRELAGATGPLMPLITEEQMDTIFATLGYNFGRRITISLDARREDRTANASEFDYTSNRLGLTITANY